MEVPAEQVWISNPSRARRLAWASLWLVVASILLTPLGAGAVLLGSVASFVTAVTALWLRAGGTAYRGALGFESDRLIVKREGRADRAFRRDDITGGCVVPTWTPPYVEFRTRGGAIVRASIDRLSQGQEMLRAGGVDAERRRLEVRVKRSTDVLGLTPSMWFALTVMFGFAAKQLPGAPTPAMYAATLAVTLLLAALVGRWRTTNVTIGRDGITIRNLRGHRFVSFANVAGLSRKENGDLEIVTTRGELVPIASGVLMPEAREMLELRIRDAMGPRDLVDADLDERRSLLARRGRTIEQWRADLAELVKLRPGYRIATLSREDLAEVIASRDATTEQRIGAAIALQTLGDATGRERIRVAAEASANDSVRIALEQAADGALDEAGLKKALGV